MVVLFDKTNIDTYEILLSNKNVYVAIKPGFISELRRKIKARYRTLSNYNKNELKLKSCTFKYMFKKYAITFQFSRIIKMSLDVGISKETVFDKIIGFRASGSHSNGIIKIPRSIKVDGDFLEGYSLYLAEGDTGLSGKTTPRKLRFTNSEIYVINHFIRWIRKYLPDLDFYISVIIPKNKDFQNIEKEHILQALNLPQSKIKFSSDSYNKKVKYRVCVDRSIVIDLFLSMEKTMKDISLLYPEYASAYIRGMMIGEGTAYSNNYSYVRLEMRNEREVKFISDLLNNLEIKHTINERNKRPGMWSIFISRKNSILKFYQMVGFGIHKKRQSVLGKIVYSIENNPDVAVTTRLIVAKAEKK